VAALVGAAISNVTASIAAANASPPKATDAAAPAVAAETPETREMVTSHFPLEGQYVVIDQLNDGVLREGLCFKVSKEGAVQPVFVVAFGDGFWLGFPPGKPWAMCPESRQVNIGGVYVANRSYVVEGYMLRSTLIEGWKVFEQFVHPWHVWPKENGAEENAKLEARWFCPAGKRRLPPLCSGDLVECTGKVWSGSGNTGVSGAGVTFIAWAQGALDEKQVKNFAVVAKPNGRLTWAQLAGRDKGFLSRSSPARMASSVELEAHWEKLPEFLAESTVSCVNSLFARMPAVDVPPEVAETRLAAQKEHARQIRQKTCSSSQGGSSQGGSSQGGSSRGPRPAKPVVAKPLADVLPADLKSVTVSFLRKQTVLQLQTLCTAKGIAFSATTADAEDLIKNLIIYRDGAGKARRKTVAHKDRTDQRPDQLDGFGDSEGGAAADAAPAALASDRKRGSRQPQAEEEEEQDRQERRTRDREATGREHTSSGWPMPISKRTEREREKTEREREKTRRAHGKKRKERSRTRTRSPSSSSSHHRGRSRHSSPPQQRYSRRRSQESSGPDSPVTPWEVIKDREDEAASIADDRARRQVRIDRHDRKKYEENQKRRKEDWRRYQERGR